MDHKLRTRLSQITGHPVPCFSHRECDDLAAWASDYASWYEQFRLEEVSKQIEELKKETKGFYFPTYNPDPRLPQLPGVPFGSLYGICYIYDDARDDRVLIAIDKLKRNIYIVAVSIHDGVVDVYSRVPFTMEYMRIGNETWSVHVRYPVDGQWVVATAHSVSRF